MINLDFYKGKNVFITGHTGFSGSWLCKILTLAGANVTGYALEAPTVPSLFELSDIKLEINSIIGDIRDFNKLKKAFLKANPEIVFHLAAQPLVRESYKNPKFTYETNVMGTVNILECIRSSNCTRSFLHVSTDKVYKNTAPDRGCREDDPLDGYDPYSNSKSCAELAARSYKRSFFGDNSVSISAVRAGNVIGGGDFAKDRIIPDCVRALENGTDITVRNPYSVRPFQHVFEPLFVYLMIAAAQYADASLSGCYNVGPDECGCINTGSLVSLFCGAWGGVSWKNAAEANAPHEADFLKLDCSKLKKTFGWKPIWDIDKAVEKTVEWTRVYFENGDIGGVMDRQIKEYLSQNPAAPCASASAMR